jgi:hypothetical protein
MSIRQAKGQTTGSHGQIELNDSPLALQNNTQGTKPPKD